METYEDTHRSTLKTLVGDVYEWGRTDAYSAVWEKLQTMKRAMDNRHEITSGYGYAIGQIEKVIDKGFEELSCERKAQCRRRMRNADNIIDGIITNATKAGYLVPRRKTHAAV